jgi:hypothetical protein
LIFMDWHHDFTHDIIVLGLCWYDDFELWVVSNIKKKFGWDVGMVVHCERKSFRVSYGNASEIEFLLFDFNVWNFNAGSYW